MRRALPLTLALAALAGCGDTAEDGGEQIRPWVAEAPYLPPRAPAAGVQRARVPGLGEVSGHRLDRHRQHRRGRGVVEVDRPAVRSRHPLTTRQVCHRIRKRTARFPALDLARDAAAAGPRATAALICADEVAVARFLAGSLGFQGITTLAAGAVERFGAGAPPSVEDLARLDAEVRGWAARTDAQGRAA